MRKTRKTPRITKQPRVLHWEYLYHDKGDYALIETISRTRSPWRTSRLLLKRHIPQWMRDSMRALDLTYDDKLGYGEAPGFGRVSNNYNTYCFYAQTENT